MAADMPRVESRDSRMFTYWLSGDAVALFSFCIRGCALASMFMDMQKLSGIGSLRTDDPSTSRCSGAYHGNLSEVWREFRILNFCTLIRELTGDAEPPHCPLNPDRVKYTDWKVEDTVSSRAAILIP